MYEFVIFNPLQAYEAVPQLRYLAKRDFTPVRLAATKALEALGKFIKLLR